MLFPQQVSAQPTTAYADSDDESWGCWSGSRRAPSRVDERWEATVGSEWTFVECCEHDKYDDHAEYDEVVECGEAQMEHDEPRSETAADADIAMPPSSPDVIEEPLVRSREEIQTNTGRGTREVSRPPELSPDVKALVRMMRKVKQKTRNAIQGKWYLQGYRPDCAVIECLPWCCIIVGDEMILPDGESVPCVATFNGTVECHGCTGIPRDGIIKWDTDDATWTRQNPVALAAKTRDTIQGEWYWQGYRPACAFIDCSTWCLIVVGDDVIFPGGGSAVTMFNGTVRCESLTGILRNGEIEWDMDDATWTRQAPEAPGAKAKAIPRPTDRFAQITL